MLSFIFFRDECDLSRMNPSITGLILGPDEDTKTLMYVHMHTLTMLASTTRRKQGHGMCLVLHCPLLISFVLLKILDTFCTKQLVWQTLFQFSQTL